MYIERIQLKNFRNYEDLDIGFNRNVNIITGNNAQGKTNLLESLFVTSLGKSFRTSRDSEMIRFEEEFARVSAHVAGLENDDRIKIEMLFRKDGKAVKVDDVKIKRISELFENVYIVIFSPEDLKIVKDEPERRRRFINRELSQLRPAYYSELVKYNKIIKQRNAYLKQESVTREMLDVWDIELAVSGAKLMRQRSIFIEKLGRISSKIHEKISGGQEKLALEYESNIRLDDNIWQESDTFGNGRSVEKKISDEFLKILTERRDSDIFRRTTGKGPHKDDIKIVVNGIDIRKYGSQGQQRTAALSLKLAEMQLIKEETGENPILLLDDVLSELDFNRQSFLINYLKNIQLFITATELPEELMKKLEALGCENNEVSDSEAEDDGFEGKNKSCKEAENKNSKTDTIKVFIVKKGKICKIKD